MTNDRMDLQAVVEKAPDADLLRETIGFAAQRPMELEIEARTACGGTSAERLAARRLPGPRLAEPDELARMQRAATRREPIDMRVNPVGRRLRRSTVLAAP